MANRDVAAHHRIGTGLAGYYLSKAESLLARIAQRRPFRLTQRPAPTSASPSAVQNCPRRRAVGACDEPTDRRGGQLVSDAQDCLEPPTDIPEEPNFFSFTCTQAYGGRVEGGGFQRAVAIASAATAPRAKGKSRQQTRFRLPPSRCLNLPSPDLRRTSGHRPRPSSRRQCSGG